LAQIQILQIGNLPFALDVGPLRESVICRVEESCAAFEIASSGEIDVVVHASAEVPIFELLLQCAKCEAPPHVVVAGSLPDDAAALLIESGAYNCVSPDEPLRLLAIVARAARLRRSLIPAKDEALRRSEEHYRFLFENSHDSVIMLEPGSEVILAANFAAHDLYRVPRGTLRGRSLLEFSSDPEPGRARAAELLAGKARVEFESRQIRDDGSEINLEICAAAIPFGDRVVILTTNRDVTTQRAAAAALAASDDRYRKLFHRATVGIVQGDLQGNIVTVNPALAQMLGYSDVQELTKVNSGDLYADAGAREEIIATLVGGAASVRREVRLIGRDGRMVWVDVNISAARNEAGRITAIEAYLLDITTRRNAEEQSARLTKDLRLVLESTNEGIVAVDTEGRCTLMNAAAARMLGCDAAEFAGQRLHEIAHHCPAGGSGSADCPMHFLVRSQQAFTREDVFRRADGTAFPVEVAGSPIIEDGQRKGTVVAFRDVTQRKALERQLEATQRISGLGRVAATIAHEFNNVLMAILPIIDVIERQLPDERLRNAAGTIRAAVSRGKQITGEILRFTRREKALRKPLSVAAYLANLRADLMPVFDRSVDLQIEMPAADLTMLADTGQLQQIFVNLAANAHDAMRDGGRMTISARREPAGQFLDGAIKDAERFVHFEVRDTGCGMDPVTQAQIFEPLFTTKQSGTGIGLAVVHQIVVDHGGAIVVRSEVGVGTTFHIFIPLTDEPVQTPPPEHELPFTAAGTYRILLVEDDMDVSSGMQMLLELEGHQVTVIGAGLEAEESVASLEPDIVVLDVGLPDISGPEVYERLSRRWPDLPVIFATGHADIAELRTRFKGSRITFLMKPFPFAAFSEAISSVMKIRG